MSKIKFVKHTRSIVRKRQDYPTSLFATIPRPIVQQWELNPGELLDGCSVSAYSTVVRTHILVANAIDNAGNSVSEELSSYTVLPWTIKGFYAPVDMNGVVNTIKSGQSVPLKFEVFAGDAEKTDPVAGGTVIESFTQKKISCGELTGDPTDAVETTTIGSTSTKYDMNTDQYNGLWKTPSNSANTCWEVSVISLDGSEITAYFKLTK